MRLRWRLQKCRYVDLEDVELLIKCYGDTLCKVFVLALELLVVLPVSEESRVKKFTT
jgi:hypothetical protein